MISLISTNGDRFQATHYACLHCKTLAYFIDEDPDVDQIPLPAVDSACLSKILEFFENRLQIVREIKEDFSVESDDVIVDTTESATLHRRSYALFDMEDTKVLLDILVAANYLNCEVLLDIISQIIAYRISGKSREEMRDILGIENDFSPEDEKRILEESRWALC